MIRIDNPEWAKARDGKVEVDTRLAELLEIAEVQEYLKLTGQLSEHLATMTKIVTENLAELCGQK